MNIIESHLIEIERGGELGDDKDWNQVQQGEFDPRQADLFPDDEKDYTMQGHFDGFDVAIMNAQPDTNVDEVTTYVLFRSAQPVAYIALKTYGDSDNDYRVSAVRIDPSEQGKGLALRFYRWLLTDGHIDRLYADENQTDGGAKIWERLLTVPGIAVFIASNSEDQQQGRRVRTVKGMSKVWQTDAYCLYAEAHK